MPLQDLPVRRSLVCEETIEEIIEQSLSSKSPLQKRFQEL